MDSPKTPLYFLLLLLLVSAVLSFLILRPFLITLALAAICTVVVYPLYQYLLPQINRRSLSALLTLVIVCLCILLPLQLVGRQVFQEAEGLYFSVTGPNNGGIEFVMDKIGNAVEPLVPGAAAYVDSYSSNLRDYIEQIIQWTIGNLGNVFSGLSNIALHLFIFFLAIYYLLIDGKDLVEHIVHWSPLPDVDDTALLKKLSASIHSVVWGSIGVALIQAVLATIGFTIFGMPNAILWGSVTLFAALVPSVGTALVFVPSVLYLFITGETAPAIGLALWGAVFVGLIDNFVSPRLSGRGTRLNPLVTLLAVFGGLSLFGFAGVFLGPIVVSFFFSLFVMYKVMIKKGSI